MAPLSSDQPPVLDAERAARASEWNFDLHAIEESELPALAYGVLLRHDEVSSLPGLDPLKLWAYVRETTSSYRPNAFHNIRHALDVLLASSYLVRAIKRAHADALADPLLVSAILISALAHDADHPGVMNGYLVATNDPLALKHDNKSVLEKHHLSIALAKMGR